MDELHLKGEKFISSKRASQITGYTKDYIGQLCRGEKIKGKLVGRNWYIKESSILEHKDVGNKKQLRKESLSDYTYEPLSYVDSAQQTRYERHRSAIPVHYRNDDRTLNPEPKKIIDANICSVRPADYKKIVTTSDTGHVVTRKKTFFESRTHFVFTFGIILVALIFFAGFFFVEQRITYTSSAGSVGRVLSI